MKKLKEQQSSANLRNFQSQKNAQNDNENNQKNAQNDNENNKQNAQNNNENNTKNPQITKLGVIFRPNTKKIAKYFASFCENATICALSVALEKQSAKQIESSSMKFTQNGKKIQIMDFSELCEWSDALVCLGGDGTLIATARNSAGKEVPILGVNLGRLGFLTDIFADSISSFLPLLKSGQFAIANHMMLEARIEKLDSIESSDKNSKNEHFFALNDILLSRPDNAGMIHIRAYIGGEYFNSYLGDGLIFATPTGSTAYNISAGGAVVYPFSRNILITPICAHSLTQRPLILPSSFELSAEILDCEYCNIIIDGQIIKKLKAKERVHIRASSHSARLIHRLDWNYFKVLKEKFAWGEK